MLRRLFEDFRQHIQVDIAAGNRMPTEPIPAGNFLCSTAAAATAPLGSVSIFIRVSRNRIVALISSSETSNTLSGHRAHDGKRHHSRAVAFAVRRQSCGRLDLHRLAGFER